MEQKFNDEGDVSWQKMTTDEFKVAEAHKSSRHRLWAGVTIGTVVFICSMWLFTVGMCGCVK